jgi:hypothetical protein
MRTLERTEAHDKKNPSVHTDRGFSSTTYVVPANKRDGFGIVWKAAPAVIGAISPRASLDVVQL